MSQIYLFLRLNLNSSTISLNRFKRYWLSDSRAGMIAASSANCDQFFIKLRIFDVYPRHLTLSWFTVSINVLKYKLNKSGDKLTPCNGRIWERMIKNYDFLQQTHFWVQKVLQLNLFVYFLHYWGDEWANWCVQSPWNTWQEVFLCRLFHEVVLK